MTAVSWKNDADGNWNTGANWSTGLVPGAADAVTISLAAAHTVSYTGGSDRVASLYTSSLATLALSGGTLAVSGNATLYGAVTQASSTLVLGPGSYVGGTYTQTSGTLQVAAGLLQLAGTGDSFAGTVTGAGVDFEAGSDLLAAGLVLSVAQFQITGATVTLGENLSQAGGFLMSSGTLALGGDTLSDNGTAALDGGATSGSGTLAVSGNTAIDNFYLTGSSVLANTGTLTASSVFYVGYYGTDTAQLLNQAGGTLRLLGNSIVYGAVNAHLGNAGLLVKAGGAGTSTVNVSTSSTGTVDVASGTLAFAGSNDSFAGSFSGAGTIAFSGGSDLLGAGLSLGVGEVVVSGAAVTLGGSLSDAGNWSDTGGTLTLGGFKLSLAGHVALDGGYVAGAGTLAVGGSTELGGSYLTGSVTLVNTGSVTQDASFYDGSVGSDTTRIVNQAGATYTIVGNDYVYGAAGAGFTNAGTLLKSGGSGIAGIGVSLTSTGTITIGQGTLRLYGPNDVLSGTIGGAGVLEFEQGAATLNKLTLTVAHVLLDGASVTLGANLKYTGDYTQNAGTLALGGHSLTLTTGNLDGGVSNGSGTIAIVKSLDFSGSALSGSVVLSNAGTITDSGSSYVGYYASDTAQLVNKAGATLLLAANAQLYGGGASTISNAGSIVKASGGGASQISDSTTSTGKILVDSGTLRFVGSANSFAGSIGGAGTLELSSGSDSLAGSTTLGVGKLLLDGANLTLAGAVTASGQFVQTAGTLALGGQTLTLSGPATFEGGAVNGSGTIAATGSIVSYALALEGSTVLTNAGALVDSNVLYAGYNASDTARLVNAASGTVTLLGGAYISGGGAGSFSNAGLLVKSGSGVSRNSAAFTSTGTITVAQGTLQLYGSSTTLGGSIGGAGVLELTGNATALNLATLSVGGVLLDGAAVTLGAALSYGGDWTQTAGTLALGGNTLTLAGTTSLDGGSTSGSGRIAAGGSTEVGNYTLQGSTVLQNTGSLTVLFDGDLYVSYASGDTATLDNAAGGHIDMLGQSRLSSAAAGIFSNAGTLTAEGSGVKYIYPATVNSGVVGVAQGGLYFQGTVAGSGAFNEGAGTQLTFAAAVSGGGVVTMGADSSLGLSTTAGFADTIAGFAAGDVIDLNGFGFDTGAPPTLSFNAGTDKLTVAEDSSSFTLAFAGAHAAGDFLAIDDHGVIGIVHS